MNSLQKINLSHDTCIKVLRLNIQLGLKWSMIKQDTLGLGNLRLEKPAAPWNVSRTKKRKAKRAKDEALLLSELQQAYGQPAPSISSWDPSMLPLHQPSPIARLGTLADTLDHWPSRGYHHCGTQFTRAIPRCHHVQSSISPSDPPTISKYHQNLTPIPHAVREVTTIPLVQPRLSSKGPASTVQKSTLSVLTYRGSPSSRVDKQYRHSRSNPPPTEPTAVQLGRRTGSPPANLRKIVSQPSRSPNSTKPRDAETSPVSSGKPSPSIIENKGSLIHLPAPIPTPAYLSDANAIPDFLPSPQRLLLVMDLNGTLLHRPRASQTYTPRPNLPRFLEYAFANHSLLVWSSAQPYNVKGVCTRLFSRDQRKKLLGEWGRNTLGLTSTQYNERVQVYKRLDRIWGDEILQRLHPDFEEGERWGQHNTVLIDDSALKASAQPFNHVAVPEFVRGGGEKDGGGRDVLGQVVEYLEQAKNWSNISAFVRYRPFEMKA